MTEFDPASLIRCPIYQVHVNEPSFIHTGLKKKTLSCDHPLLCETRAEDDIEHPLLCETREDDL